MNRMDVNGKDRCAKVMKGIKWDRRLPPRSALSKEWVTAACLGQKDDAHRPAGAHRRRDFGLSAEERRWLCVVPYKGSLPTANSHRFLLIYRFYELVNVYGTHVQGIDP